MIKELKPVYGVSRIELDEYKEDLNACMGQVNALLGEIEGISHTHTVDRVGQQIGIMKLKELQTLLKNIDHALDTPPACMETLPAMIACYNSKLPQVLSWLDTHRRIRNMEEASLDVLDFDNVDTEIDTAEDYDSFIAEVSEQIESGYDSIIKHLRIVEKKQHKDVVTTEHKLELIMSLEKLTGTIAAINEAIEDEDCHVHHIKFMLEIYNDKIDEVFHLMIDNPRLWHD